VFYLFTRYLRV